MQGGSRQAAAGGHTWKLRQVEHWFQCVSWYQVTVEWPSWDMSRPRKLSCMYQATKAPTVAKPTYVPTSSHLLPRSFELKGYSSRET